MFGTQLQPAGGNKAQPPGLFGHHGGEAGMAKAFFLGGQHVLAGFCKFDACGVEDVGGEAYDNVFCSVPATLTRSSRQPSGSADRTAGSGPQDPRA